LREAMRIYLREPCWERKGPLGKLVMGRGRVNGMEWFPA
jgi:hypothetical protein